MTTIRAALVTPLSGSLGGFGRAGAHALELWARAAAALPPPAGRVDLSVHDAAPDTAAALRAALATRPQLLFGPYGSGPALALARRTDRLIWNHGGAASELGGTAYPQVVSLLAPAASYHQGALALLRRLDPGLATVVLLHGEGGFGRDVAAGAEDAARRLGFTVRRVAIPAGRAAPVATRAPEGDVLLVAGSFADELAVARATLPRRWRAAAFVGAGEEGVLAGLGAAREGLLGPTQWVASVAPEPDEGPPAGWFVRAYQAEVGEPPPYPAAQAFAAGLVAARCARDAGVLDEAALRAAARSLRCTTLYGRFRLDDRGRQVGHRVLTVQWQGGRRRVVWPAELAEVPTVHPRA